MSEKPIIFTAESLRAILAGRKTQTRRITKAQPPKCRYQPGDRLWVRENWAAVPMQPVFSVHYQADNSLRNIYDEPEVWAYESTKGWRSSRFMPKWAARIWLEVITSRIETLRDITPADIIAEGCPPEHYPENCSGMTHALYGWYENLWDKLNAKRGYPWDSNPLVEVVEFPPFNGGGL